MLKQIAKVARIANSASNHEGYLHKLPQSVAPSGSKKSNRKKLKRSGIWNGAFCPQTGNISAGIL